MWADSARSAISMLLSPSSLCFTGRRKNRIKTLFGEPADQEDADKRLNTTISPGPGCQVPYNQRWGKVRNQSEKAINLVIALEWQTSGSRMCSFLPAIHRWTGLNKGTLAEQSGREAGFAEAGHWCMITIRAATKKQVKQFQ